MLSSEKVTPKPTPKATYLSTILSPLSNACSTILGTIERRFFQVSQHALVQGLLGVLKNTYNHPLCKRSIDLASGLCMGALCFYSTICLFDALPAATYALIPAPYLLAFGLSLADVIATIALFTDTPEEVYSDPHWGWYVLATLSSCLVASAAAMTSYVFTISYVPTAAALVMAACGFVTNFRIFQDHGAQKLKLFFKGDTNTDNTDTDTHDNTSKDLPPSTNTPPKQHTALFSSSVFLLATTQSFAYCALNATALFAFFAWLGPIGLFARSLTALLVAGLFVGEINFNRHAIASFFSHTAPSKQDIRMSWITPKALTKVFVSCINAVANGLIILADFKHSHRFLKSLLFVNGSSISFFVMSNNLFPKSSGKPREYIHNNAYLPRDARMRMKLLCGFQAACLTPLIYLASLPIAAVGSALALTNLCLLTGVCASLTTTLYKLTQTTVAKAETKYQTHNTPSSKFTPKPLVSSHTQEGMGLERNHKTASDSRSENAAQDSTTEAAKNAP